MSRQRTKQCYSGLFGFFRNWFSVIVFTLLAVAFAHSQSFDADLETAKKIRLLEVDAESVARMLEPESAFYSAGWFSRESTLIMVHYSSGRCTEGDTFGVDADDWNVAQGIATEVIVQPKDRVTISKLGFDLKKFKREKLYRGIKEHYVYHDKTNGTAITTISDSVRSIIFFPSSVSHSQLCTDEKIRKYYAGRNWHRDPQPKYGCVLTNDAANVVDLGLSIVGSDGRVLVTTKMEDPENDVVMFNYKVSGGTILGVGANVEWDLSSVAPGTYRITAAVDDGCGLCGKYITKSVTIN